MDKHANWSLWDEDDLSRKVRRLSREAAIRLVDTFFPGYRERFLGERAPGPWLSASEFFPDTFETLLKHRQMLFGRDHLVEEICTWLREGHEQIGVLVGRAGLGKSKLLFEVARHTAGEHVECRFLGVGQRPTPESFDILPIDQSLVIVIDDAHNSEGIAEIASQLFLQRPKAKLLLATRPYGTTSLDVEMWRLDQAPRSAPRWTLDDLSFDDALALASDLLDRPVTDPFVKQLASISADCPFLAVAAADLIKRNQFEATSLTSSQELRADLIRRFSEVVVLQGGVNDNEERRAVLNALAAFQPVRVGDPNFQAAMVSLTRVQTWDLVSGRIRELEDRGVVLRRGESVRIVPDLIGDILLGQAAYDDRSHVATQYLERAQAAASGAVLQHLLHNASRVDWQVRAGKPGPPLVRQLWDTLRAQVVEADYDGQVALLMLVEKVAFYQPAPSIDLVADVLSREPVVSPRRPSNELWTLSSTRRDVIAAVPPVLRNAAYDYDYLGDCLDLLWELAQIDDRPTNQFPDHPLRVLRELANLRSGKPFVFIDKIIDKAEEWLAAPTTQAVSPFDVVEPILATEGTDETSSGLKLTFRSFAILPESVHNVRTRVVSLAEHEARGSDPVRAVRAVQLLENAIREPVGSRTPSDEEKAAWTAEFLPIIRELGVIGAEVKRDPTVRLAIRQALGWHVSNGHPPALHAANDAMGKLATSLEDELALCLHNGWGRLGLGHDLDYEAAEHERLAKFGSSLDRVDLR
jgi:hypothetical protein